MRPNDLNLWNKFWSAMNTLSGTGIEAVEIPDTAQAFDILRQTALLSCLPNLSSIILPHSHQASYSVWPHTLAVGYRAPTGAAPGSPESPMGVPVSAEAALGEDQPELTGVSNAMVRWFESGPLTNERLQQMGDAMEAAFARCRTKLDANAKRAVNAAPGPAMDERRASVESLPTQASVSEARESELPVPALRAHDVNERIKQTCAQLMQSAIQIRFSAASTAQRANGIFNLLEQEDRKATREIGDQVFGEALQRALKPKYLMILRMVNGLKCHDDQDKIAVVKALGKLQELMGGQVEDQPGQEWWRNRDAHMDYRLDRLLREMKTGNLDTLDVAGVYEELDQCAQDMSRLDVPTQKKYRAYIADMLTSIGNHHFDVRRKELANGIRDELDHTRFNRLPVAPQPALPVREQGPRHLVRAHDEMNPSDVVNAPTDLRLRLSLEGSSSPDKENPSDPRSRLSDD
jgi:hypothetical protein